VEHHKDSEARQSTMPAARKTAENSFRLPAPADRWIQAKPMGDEVSGAEVGDADQESAADTVKLQLTVWQQYL
jgi:hypothetical protein